MDYRIEDLPERANRRWPPFAAGGVALILVFAALPNPFRIPQNNPAPAAEYAPVPGGDGDAQQANFAQTALATGSTIEASGEASLEGPGPLVLPRQFKPRQKFCVGDPARQTEDPLSPWCVPFFAGDNGGATFHGVTRDEITVVLYNDWDVEGDMSKPYKPSDEPTRFQGANFDINGPNLVRTIKAHLRYFQERFQTYGRRVRVIAQTSSGGLNSTCEQRTADGSQTKGDHEPFAAMDFSARAASCYIDRISGRHGIVNFGINWDLPRITYERNAPNVFGFYPDQQTEADWSASFLCKTLLGKPARFANDPAMRLKPQRTFGLIHPQSARTTGDDRPADLIRATLQRTCGFTFDEAMTYKGDASSREGNTNATIINRFKNEGITTVLCYCNTGLVAQLQSQATSSQYFPEWYFDHGSGMFRPNANRSGDSSQARAFGVTHLWLQPRFESQYHYEAFLTEEPGYTPNFNLSFSIYYQFMNLFTGIQAAGPLLTPDSVRRGMFTFNYLQPEEPLVPSGGYGPYDSRALGDYSFVDTATAWWWDPNGRPPGGQPGEGCIRLMNGARRYFPGDWPKHDTQIFDDATGKCTADTVKVDRSGPF